MDFASPIWQPKRSVRNKSLAFSAWHRCLTQQLRMKVIAFQGEDDPGDILAKSLPRRPYFLLCCADLLLSRTSSGRSPDHLSFHLYLNWRQKNRCQSRFQQLLTFSTLL